MAGTTQADAAAVLTLSDDEMTAFFDTQARSLLGISGDEFLERWDDGAYAGDDSPDVVHLAMLAIRSE